MAEKRTVKKTEDTTEKKAVGALTSPPDAPDPKPADEKVNAEALAKAAEAALPGPSENEEEGVVTVQAAAVPADEEKPEAPADAPAPSVGRMVHFKLHGRTAPLAAIVTAVPEEPKAGDPASLVIYREHLQFFRREVPFSATPKDGHWSWPARV